MLSHRWAGEMVINGLDCGIDPVGSAFLAFFAWDEGGSLLGGCAPEVGLDSVLGIAFVSAVAWHQQE